MKHLLIAVLLLGSYLLQAQNTPGTVSVTVTSKPNGKDFSPKHVLAIWVEDNTDAFVKTLKLRADKRKQYLYTWNSKSAGDVTDATTGATLSAHTMHSVLWDCTNTAGEVVGDGDYKIMIEYTSEHKQGPLASIDFIKSGDLFSVQPKDETFFTDMDVVFTPESSSGLVQESLANQLSVYPVPATNRCFIDFSLAGRKNMELRVYSADMKLVEELWKGDLEAGKHSFSWDIEGSNSAPGSYFIVLSGDNMFSVRAVVFTGE